MNSLNKLRKSLEVDYEGITLNSETKIGRLKTTELKLREHNASEYLGQGTRIINGVKYNHLLGYLVTWLQGSF